jgi:general secretion pathway protein A
VTTIQLDRPAVLHLVDARGRPAYAVLVALSSDVATLAAAGAQRELAIADLAPAWRGEFTTLWRTPPGWRDGASGADAAWLARQLERAGDAASAASTLQQRLLAFQAAQGLTPDGIAGPLTLMRLNRAGGVDEPRL